MLSALRRFHSEVAAQPKKNIFGRKALPGIGRIIMTASCKGGVGKSTVAINTACALAKQGARVGIFDADIYGPSVPTMMKTTDQSMICDKDSHFIPVENHGIATVSIGYAINPEDALLFKGPIITNVITEFLRNCIWPELDYLILDTPPGTGDVPMAIATTVPVDGAILVTAPQDIVVADVVRNFDMFKQLKIPVLGLVENFNSFVCKKCHTKTKIFPGMGAEDLSKQFKVDILGSLPIDPEICKAGDDGVPAVISHPNNRYTATFEEIAQKIMKKLPIIKPKYPAIKLETEEKK